MKLPTKPRYGNQESNIMVLAQQEDLNRDFVSAISTLEVVTTSLKDEMREMKKSVADLVKQMIQIKLMFLGLFLGILLNANPNDWVKFFHSVSTVLIP